MKEEGILTQAVDKASDLLMKARQKNKDMMPVPFMQRKVSGNEVRRKVERKINKGRLEPSDLLELVNKYGYEGVNEVLGRIYEGGKK